MTDFGSLEERQRVLAGADARDIGRVLEYFGPPLPDTPKPKGPLTLLLVVAGSRRQFDDYVRTSVDRETTRAVYVKSSQEIETSRGVSREQLRYVTVGTWNYSSQAQMLVDLLRAKGVQEL